MKRASRWAVGVFFSISVSAAAVAAPSQNPYPERFQAVIACRDVAAADARLACFDQATAALATAAQAGDIAVADKAQITEAKKGLFGFTAQNIKLFSAPDGRDDFDQIEDIVSSAEQLRGGQWSITLPNGAAWAQVDTATLAVDPKPGMKIIIRRAAMGSFLARLGNQPAIRVRRTR
jgi:hypothetical protein